MSSTKNGCTSLSPIAPDQTLGVNSTEDQATSAPVTKGVTPVHRFGTGSPSGQLDYLNQLRFDFSRDDGSSRTGALPNSGNRDEVEQRGSTSEKTK
ncbi:hypothetical protein QE152_g25872 [Popillia japonica]|uniref:Uncharacterized protein n=1 Tax=Popillia japonica TaxID=7064 RepID=A0AAW1K0M7_POPJA